MEETLHGVKSKRPIRLLPLSRDLGEPIVLDRFDQEVPLDLSIFPNVNAHPGCARNRRGIHMMDEAIQELIGGEDALLVSAGSWVYNVATKPYIYYELARCESA